jgi:hypothetical protein
MPTLLQLYPAQYSDQCSGPPTGSNCVSFHTRLRALSSLPKQQNRRASPLRFRGVRPSYGDSLFGELDVEEVGLSGIVALMKMSESWLRYRVSIRDCGDCFSEDEYGEALTGVRDGCCVCVFDGKVVVSGESSWRFARGDVGRPVSERATMLAGSERAAIAGFWVRRLPDLYIDNVQAPGMFRFDQQYESFL